MSPLSYRIAMISLVLTTSTAVRAQHEHPNNPAMDKCPAHESHMAALKERGARAMGFDQDKTTHHFKLAPNGGAIEVEANDSNDTSSRDQIRHHLGMIREMFAAGDFSKPFEVHAQAPPGVEGMTRLRETINYDFEATERGGRIRISTLNKEAVSAIHEFLRFQITDHKTGDSVK